MLAGAWLNCQNLRALDYEVYPGAAYYMTQMVSSASFPYTAQFANGFYYNPWAFGNNSDTVLSTQQKQAICNNFSNRFVMVEGQQGNNDPNIDINDINTMRGFGLTPVAAFINQPADPFFWAQTVANNGALQTPSYEMLPPWWVGQGSGWSGWTKQQTNMLVWGCCGSGVDSPVNLYFSGNGISPAAYQKAVWDQCQWSQSVGKKFNYLASPNTDTGQQFLVDMERVARSLEDNGAEPNVYGVELYGVRPVNLVPETITNNNGVVQANWTITGLAYYLLKHRDGEPGTLDLYATSNSVNYAQGVMSPILTNSAQIIPFDPTQTNQFTLTLTNRSAWLDYTAVLRARTAQAANWNITFKIGSTDISSSVLNHSGYVFLSSHRLLTNTAQQVTVTLSPKVLGAPTPLDLVIEALPHAGVDQALDTIAFQYQTNQSPPTLDFPTNDWFTLQGMGVAPIWFTVGDVETISSNLTVTAVSGNTTLLPNNKIIFGLSGIQRWVTLSPVSSQWGTAPVTLIVSDGQFSASNTFNVFVQQTNTFPYVKANNTVNLELTNSWVTNAVPDEFGVAIWDSTVTSANTTTLGVDDAWAGIQIKNPGGAVTINGTNTLGLGSAGVDMSGASQNFTLNCPAVLDANVTCNLASSRVMTMNGIVSGLASITKSGSGLLVLSGANTYSGGVSINGTSGSKNPLLASNNLALGTGAVTIGGGGNNDAACLELAGGITVGNNLGVWDSRNTTAPNLLNVNGTNTVTHGISAGNGGGQSTFESDSGDLVMTGGITTRQLNLQGAGNGELRGAVAIGSYGVVKTGSGTWTLNADNTYTGGTTINGGKLVGAVAGSCSNSAVTVAATSGNTAVLGVSVANPANQWTCASLTVNNAGTSSGLDFNFGTQVPSTTLAPLGVLGAATFTTVPTLTVELPNTGLGGAGTVYPLMSWSGSSVSAPAVTVTGSHATAHTTVTGTSPNYTLNLVIDSTSEPLRWALSGAGIWDTTTANWKIPNGTATAYNETVQPGDAVVFDETYITANTTVTLNTNVTPTSVSVVNSAYNYTIAGPGSLLGGAGDVIGKGGTGTLTLNTGSAGTPSQIGSVYVTNGTVNLGGYLNAASGASGFAFKVINGGTLNLGGITVATNTYISIADGGGSGTVNVTNGTTTAGLSFSLFMGKGNATGTLNVSNATFNLTAGAVYVAASYNGGQETGANTAGNLNIFSNGVFNTGTSTGNFMVGNGNAASIKGTINLNAGGTLATARSIINGATSLAVSTFNFDGGTLKSTATNANFITNLVINVRNGGAIIDTTGGSVTIGQALGHSTIGGDNATDGGLTKNGANTLTLAGTNTDTGNTTVNGGTLELKLPVLAASSTISVAANAVLQLDFTVTNKVQNLVLNGINRAPGFYNSSTAAPYLTGGGTLQVTGNTNANLASLAVNPPAGLLLNFATNIYSYTVTNGFASNPVTVTAASVDTNATLQLSFNGTLVGTLTNNVASPNQTLLLAKTNTLAVRVVSPDGSVTNLYTVNVLLQPSQTAFTLAPAIDGGTNLILNWPTDHTGYRLLVQTNNLVNGISNNTNDWMTLINYSTTNTAVLPILKTNLNQYYRLVYP